MYRFNNRNVNEWIEEHALEGRQWDVEVVDGVPLETEVVMVDNRGALVLVDLVVMEQVAVVSGDRQVNKFCKELYISFNVLVAFQRYRNTVSRFVIIRIAYSSFAL